jgi:membrane protease YdiL (CAAX protease family)
MEPEIQPLPPEAPPAPADATLTPETVASTTEEKLLRGLRWTFLGSQGLRAGWSVLIFAILLLILATGMGYAFFHMHLIGKKSGFTAATAFFEELSVLLPLLGTAAFVAFVERRRSLLAFNLTGPRCIPRFFSGLLAGYLALSALVGALTWGGWMHFGPIALTGAEIFKYGALWAAAFLLVGCVEEGIFRCYLQFTFTRGINFWWALGIVAGLCLDLLLRSKGNGVWGVYAIALLGLLPCFWLQLIKMEGRGFWQAAWVTSTLFGYIHTGNGGENWIGIFAAAFIGFVFCVSVRITGSAWWAIGCHAAWDWAETFFYGTADSGLVASGHYLNASPAGNAFWSGGADGPEGSVLVLGIILLMLAALLLIYGRKKPELLAAQSLERAIG